MPKKKGIRAKEAKAKRAARNASPEPSSTQTPTSGLAVPADGQRVCKGLANLGNTCFMNSILQCLNVSMPFSDQLIKLDLNETLSEVAGALSSVFRGIRGLEDGHKATGVYSPKPLQTRLVSRFPWYRGGQQHDAHELLRTLLGCVSDEVTAVERKERSENGSVPRNTSGPANRCERCIWDNFRGHLCAVVLCWDCGRVSMKLDPFLDLSLELPPLRTTPPKRPLGLLGKSDESALPPPPPPPSLPPPPLSDDEADAGDDADSDGCPRSKRRREKQERKKKGGGRAPRNASGLIQPALPQPREPGPAPRAALGAWANGPAPAVGKHTRIEMAAREAVEEAVEQALFMVDARKGARCLLSDLFGRLAWRMVEDLPEAATAGAAGEAADAAGEAADAEGEAGSMDAGAASEADVDADAETDGPCPTVEIELTRLSRKQSPHWGFKWAEAELQEDIMLLVGINEESIVEKWNLKQRALSDEESVICVGDRLVEVNGETTRRTMQRALRSEDTVALRFVRGGAPSASERKKGKRRKSARGLDESDEDAKREELAKAAEREARWRSFEDKAEACYASLPDMLRDIFGPEKRKETNGHLDLEDCLHNFSAVEALEQDFAPSYLCSSCGKSEGSGSGSQRTYASKRLWLCSAELPPLLTLQLKRFRQYFGQFEKSGMSVRLPATLDLSDFVLGQECMNKLREHLVEGCTMPDSLAASSSKGLPRYELYGICVHQGSSMKGGHYVAYVNAGPTIERENWFGVSDAKVWQCNRAEVLKQEAYVAFYRREDCAAEAAAAAHAPNQAAADAAKKEDEDSDDE